MHVDSYLAFKSAAAAYAISSSLLTRFFAFLFCLLIILIIGLSPSLELLSQLLTSIYTLSLVSSLSSFV